MQCIVHTSVSFSSTFHIGTSSAPGWDESSTRVPS